MQAPIKATTANKPRNETRIAVKFQRTKQQPQTVQPKIVNEADARLSLCRNLDLLERGVPFSPLND